MGRTSKRINAGDSPGRENWDVPDLNDIRWRRRIKRRLCWNEDLKRNRCAGSATRITVKNCGDMDVLTDGNGHVVEDEADEDYKMFLDYYFHDSDDDNVDGSDIVFNTGYNSDNDDNLDPQLKMFLENLREDGKSYVFEAYVDNQLVRVKYEGEEEEEEDEEEEKLYDELNSDTPNILKGFTWRDETGNVGNTGSGSGREQTGSPMESQNSLENERDAQGKEGSSSIVRQCLQVSDGGIEPCNKRPVSNVSSVPKRNGNSEVGFDDVDEDYLIFLNSDRIDGDEGSELKGNGSMKNSQVSDLTLDAPKVQVDIDEQYQLHLNNLEYMPEGNNTKEYNGVDDSDPSEPELIVLEPNQFCEGTPFISSKMYDSSWFDYARNSSDGKRLSVFEHSQFRKRLMESLERPYDQEEYDSYLHEVHHQRRKERIRETRSGVKSCLVHGVNKSYLELYPELKNAIDQAKEPHRVLFLLRGFIYWLENVTQEGAFQPWLDESCLVTLQKM